MFSQIKLQLIKKIKYDIKLLLPPLPSFRTGAERAPHHKVTELSPSRMDQCGPIWTLRPALKDRRDWLLRRGCGAGGEGGVCYEGGHRWRVIGCGAWWGVLYSREGIKFYLND